MGTQKAQKILRYLDQTLDPQYEISGSLSALYDYFIRRLVEANLHKDNGPIGGSIFLRPPNGHKTATRHA